MKIQILSRIKVEKLVEDKTPIPNSAIISIWECRRFLEMITVSDLKKMGCHHFLDLHFDDISPKYAHIPIAGTDKKPILFDKVHGAQVLYFLDEIKEKGIDHLIVHCTAGISRSAAIGVFAIRHYNLDENKFRQDNSHILPNTHILDVLNDLSGVKAATEEFWKNKMNDRFDSMWRKPNETVT